jgi:hypothetical protein
MAKFNTYVRGFYNDFNAGGEIFQKEMIRVTYSADPIGKTLSIGSDKHNIQMTIPFDAILEMINK